MNNEAQLLEDISTFVTDPLGYVNYTFPWGKGILADPPYNQPDKWQIKFLDELGNRLENTQGPIRMGAGSGHGIGKTTLISWLIKWFSSTKDHPEIIVTANTKTQLETKTWRELAKWNNIAIDGHWFNWTATKFTHNQYPETWFAIATPWSKERSEAFQGSHEKNIMILMDEASAIEDIIWDVCEGACTTTGGFVIWIVFGNRTRNTGKFAECFKKHRHRWDMHEIDSRTSAIADQALIQQWIDDYGEDSDFVRVRVKGQEPRAGVFQFIPNDIVEPAIGKVVRIGEYDQFPKILTVDPARFGDDKSTILKRQGMVAFDLKKYRGIDTMTLAGIVAQIIDEWKPDAIFIDEIGIGAGVVDRLRQLGYDIIGVNSATRMPPDSPYYNLRAYMWGKGRDWLKAGGALPDDNEMRDDLIGPEYGYSSTDQIQLEKKEDMKKRGLASPDCGDVLMLGFAQPVRPKEDSIIEYLENKQDEYNPLEYGLN